MNWRKKIILLVIVISLIGITTGCRTEVYSTNQINPIEKEKISVVFINKGSSQQEIMDKGMISEMIDNLNNIKVKKISQDEDAKILDSGNALKKNSTIIIHLNNTNNDFISMAILLSEKELLLPDVKSMKSSKYTASYLSDIDETTLKSIKALYSLAEKI